MPSTIALKGMVLYVFAKNSRVSTKQKTFSKVVVFSSWNVFLCKTALILLCPLHRSSWFLRPKQYQLSKSKSSAEWHTNSTDLCQLKIHNNRCVCMPTLKKITIWRIIAWSFFYTQAHWRLDFVPHSCKLTPQTWHTSKLRHSSL